jgi:NitT/TauT family transport system substrate-binding protein
MKRIAALCGVSLLAVALLAACGPQEVEQPPDEVSVRLKWLHNTQSAGFYVAEQNGYYAEENIAVTLLPGGPDVDELASVASGQDMFGVVGADQLIIRQSEVQPTVAIAAIFRRNPAVYFALRETGIDEPEDFTGRRVLVYPGDFMLPAMLERSGVGIEQIEAVEPGAAASLDALYSGEVEIWTGYLTNEVITAGGQGYELNIIYPDDYGVHVYGDVVIASAKLTEENPDLAERFLRATLRGWRYAVENPEEAVAATLKYDDTLDEAHETAAMEASVPLIRTGEDRIGWMRAEVWEDMQQMLVEQGLLDEPVDLDTVYTMEFLERVYGE